MGRKKSGSRPVKARLSGYVLWAFERYRDEYQKTNGAALAWIVERWAELDSDFLEKRGITNEAFRRDTGDNVRTLEKNARGAKFDEPKKR